IDFFAVLLLHILVHVGHVQNLFFISRRWGQEHEQVMPFLRLGFCRSAGVDGRQVDVVHDNRSVVLLPPLHRVFLVEPLIPGRHEMSPLADLQRLLLGRGTLRKQKCRPQRSGGDASRSGDLDEVSTRYVCALLLTHNASSVSGAQLTSVLEPMAIKLVIPKADFARGICSCWGSSRDRSRFLASLGMTIPWRFPRVLAGTVSTFLLRIFLNPLAHP